MGYFTVICLVTWPLNGSEAGNDLVLIHLQSLGENKSKFFLGDLHDSNSQTFASLFFFLTRKLSK